MSLSHWFGQACQALFFPQACVLCERWVLNADFSPLCYGCLPSLVPLAERVCLYCGTPMPGVLEDIHATCSQCRGGPTRPYDWARAYGAYQGPLRLVIRKFKFEGFRRLAWPLSRLLESCFGCMGPGQEPDWLVPVPLHPRRRRERGFDQTLLLSQLLSRKLGIPVFSGLRRVRPTRPQPGLNLRDRRRNLRGAFQVENSGAIRDKSVLLVDDVMTSGTTVAEISHLLRRESAVSRILVLTLARVPLLHSGF